ncbi:hypothetical protein [Neisseria sp. Ec49-e6-T10]|uniref:hypothetical protein n=1 Tax=Neisseria sp. Ec49-e6-T10 TaxID=3140744 RepID=UPI003EB9F3B7
MSFLLFTGCAMQEPIYNAQSKVPAGLTVKQVEKAILDAQQSNRGWVLKKRSDNLIEGKLLNRGFLVTVRIPYSATDYRIEYVSSQGLDVENGKIHRNYNRWINNLDHDIQFKLLQAEE